MQLDNLWLYVVAIALVLIAAVLFLRGYEKSALATLFAGALSIRLFVAWLDPFLNMWDERYHALVARNMMTHPFKPMLVRDTLLRYDYSNWCDNHIWLHKQPLFLWQMALSMKIFGVSEFTIRYPSVLMGALMVLLVYRITLLLTQDKISAFTAAVFMCFSHYQMDLISGYKGMDHNDVAFGFYVLASIWAYAEYVNEKKVGWVLSIGFLAGCAILNKWLPGLLVFAGWGINVLIGLVKKEGFKEATHFLLALLACGITFLPWQIYIFHAFPLEARYEFAFNARHIFEVVEGHAGSNSFYWDRFPDYFGAYSWFLLVPGFVLLLAGKYQKSLRLHFVISFLLIFLFYSLIVKTKIDSYFFVVAPIGYIIIAIGFVSILRLIKGPKYVLIPLSLIAGLIMFDYKHIVLAHDPQNATRISRIALTKIYKNLKNYILPDTRYIMNTIDMENIDIMFFNINVSAKTYCISPEDLEIVKKNHLRIAAFEDHYSFTVPQYIRNYPLTYIIPIKLP